MRDQDSAGAESDQIVTVVSPQVAELRAAPRDDKPLEADEIAGRTLASVISPGTELAWAYLGDKHPAIPGYANVCRVETVGASVAKFKPGDLAFSFHPHRLFIRGREREMIRVPNGLDPRIATFARLMAVSMSTLTTTRARPPQLVLVTGLGPVGHLAAKIFAACGYDVIAVDPVASRREMLANVSGIRRVLDKTPLDDPQIRDHVALALECAGHERAVLDACKIVRKGGEVVMVGVPWTKKADLSAHDLLHPIFHRYVTLRSGWEWELPAQISDFRTNSIQSNHEAALQWLAEGRVPVDGLYQTVSPRECQQAYQDLLHQRTKQLAIVFDWEKL